MELLKSTEEFKGFGSRSAVTIGVFDGVHQGHQSIIAECVREAAERGVPAVVLTFERNPREVVSGESPCAITAPHRKLELLAEMGVGFTVEVKFSRSFASLKPDEFCRRILVGDLGAVEVCVGDNFRYGAGGKGDVAGLARQGERLGFDVDVVPLRSMGGELLSSTLIRGLINQGRIEEVTGGLGRPYTVNGRVEPGHARGKRMGYPTANLALERDFCVPAEGVYAGKAILGETGYLCAINIGSNPTFGDEEVALEVFLIDFHSDIYGESLDIEFHHRLREEVAFADEQELIGQIEKDVEMVRRLL